MNIFLEKNSIPQFSSLSGNNKICHSQEKNTTLSGNLINSDQSFAVRSNALARINFKAKDSKLIKTRLDEIFNDAISDKIILSVNDKGIENLAEKIEKDPSKRRVAYLSGKAGTENLDLARNLLREFKGSEGLIAFINGDNYHKGFYKTFQKCGQNINTVIQQAKINMHSANAFDLELMYKDINYLIGGYRYTTWIPEFDAKNGLSTYHKIFVKGPKPGGILLVYTNHVDPSTPGLKIASIYRGGVELKDCKEIVDVEEYDKITSRILYNQANAAAANYFKKNTPDIILNAEASFKERVEVLTQIFKVISGVE